MPLVVRSISVWLKIALVSLSLGTVLFIIGFATDSWMVGLYSGRSRAGIGLWKSWHCQQQTWTVCPSSRIPSYNLEDFHRAVQAMECLGLIAVLMGLLLLILYTFVDSCRRRVAILSTIFFIFGAVFCMLIGIIIFAIKYEERSWEIGWSMGIAIAGTVLTFIAGIMCVMQIMTR